MKRRTVGLLLAGALVLGACGGDDDDDTDDAAGEAPEWCTPYIELLAGDPEPDEIREVAAVAPDGAKEHLETIAAGFEEDPEGFFDTEEFNTAFSEVGAAANDDCADDVIEVTAVDYGFQGIPSEVDAGTLGVTFTNDGTEFHELAVMRKADGETRSWDEILELAEDEVESAIVEVGGGFAPPGGTNSTLLDLAEPGEYIAVCFVPVGATPDASEEEVDGPPHHTQGMKVEFTVS